MTTGDVVIIVITSVLLILISVNFEPRYPKPVLKEGFPLQFPRQQGFTTLDGPVAADIDSDGNLEIVMNISRKMHVINSDGTNAAGFPVSIDHIMQHSPAVGDLDGDGSLEIVAQARSANINETYVYAWHSDGSLVSGFPVTFGGGFYESPVLYDLDKNGKLEVIMSFNNKVYVIDYDGSVKSGWPVEIGRINNSRPAVGDINGDGYSDVIVGTYAKDKITGEESGYLFAINHLGELLRGFPIPADSGLGFHRSDPVLADFDGDGVLEIAVTMVNYESPYASRTVVFDGDGKSVNKWDTGYSGSRLSIADLDRDGILEILTWSFDSIYVNNINDRKIEGWPAAVNIHWNEYEGAIGNIYGSNGYELLWGSSARKHGKSWIWSKSSEGIPLPWSPIRVDGFQLSVLLLSDLERDGLVDIVRVSYTIDPPQTLIHAYEVPGSDYNLNEFPWAMYGHDRYHTGQYGFVPSD